MERIYIFVKNQYIITDELHKGYTCFETCLITNEGEFKIDAVLHDATVEDFLEWSEEITIGEFRNRMYQIKSEAMQQIDEVYNICCNIEKILTKLDTAV